MSLCEQNRASMPVILYEFDHQVTKEVSMYVH